MKFVRYDRDTLIKIMSDILRKIHSHHETRITDFEMEYADIKEEETSISFGFWRELDIVKESSASLIHAPVGRLIKLVTEIPLPTSKEDKTGLHTFVGECKAIKKEIAEALASRKEKLRELFKQSLVYSPLVVMPEAYFNNADGIKIYAKYLHNANEQFVKVRDDPNAPFDIKNGIGELETRTKKKLDEVLQTGFKIHYTEMSRYIHGLNLEADGIFEEARAVCIDYSIIKLVYFLSKFVIEYLLWLECSSSIQPVQ